MSDRRDGRQQADAEDHDRQHGLEQRDAALAHIEHMRRSRSWRLTRPLRMLMQLLRHGVINDESEYPTHLPSLVQPLPASTPLEPDIVEDSAPGSAAQHFDLLCA